MGPCPHCGKKTAGTIAGEVVHATCPACTKIALRADGYSHLASEVEDLEPVNKTARAHAGKKSNK